MSITPFLKNEALSPEAIQAMAAAFSHACERLQLSGDAADRKVEIVASKIIDLAQRGIRDPDTLCRRALQDLGADG